MSDPLQDRFDVTIEYPAEEEGKPPQRDVYTFRRPTIKYEIQVSTKAADVRLRAHPEGAGAMAGLDMNAVMFARYCAIIELYLLTATTPWPWGVLDEDRDKIDFSKPPKVDFEKFPVQATDDVWRVGQAFEVEWGRFRSRRNTNGSSVGAEVVDGVGYSRAS